jgi:phenylpropionate dioxygenase-like ring-hydroxylating dioxygenase large terminal subunit
MGQKAFNNASVYCRGWYWALPAKDLPLMGVHSLQILGRELVLFRGESGKVFAIHPYCPHMGAHLKLGSVEGDAIQCRFHGWKYSGDGKCLGAPPENLNQPKVLPEAQPVFKVAEKFGMIWFHPDVNTTDPLPDFPALAGKKNHAETDEVETRFCHPTLILGGGVDEDHFNFVHRETIQQTGPLLFSSTRISPQVITFDNVASIPKNSWKRKIVSWLYRGTLRYRVSYWYGTTAFAELGFPWFPLYSIFAYRPTPEGHTQGLNIYVTPYSGLLGTLAIFLTRATLKKGGGEDTPIQNSLRFQETQWVKESGSFANFIDYVNEQPVLPAGEK